MGCFDDFEAAKAQYPVTSRDHSADNSAVQLQAELDAHLVSIGRGHTEASTSSVDYSIDHWAVESAQSLPHVTWAPMDRFPNRSVKQTQWIHGHGYIRYDDAMILRPLGVTTRQLEFARRRLA